MSRPVEDVHLRLTVLREVVVDCSLAAVQIYNSDAQTGGCCQS